MIREATNNILVLLEGRDVLEPIRYALLAYFIGHQAPSSSQRKAFQARPG